MGVHDVSAGTHVRAGIIRWTEEIQQPDRASLGQGCEGIIGTSAEATSSQSDQDSPALPGREEGKGSSKTRYVAVSGN